MIKPIEKMRESAEYLRKKLNVQPEVAIVLGSGLGMLADEIEQAVEINYSDIPNFPVSTVEGHAGKLVVGKLKGRHVMAMKGRFHYYEGYSMDEVVFPVRVMKLLGINNLLVTNAAGGINKDFEPGDLMLIKDHIKFFSESPLRGKNIDEFGLRFNDMSNAYTEDLRELAKEVAYGLGITVREGVYAFMPGPSYETPAEIRMLGIVGADAVGMSTVPEVIAAAHAGMKVLGISCITNMAAGILDQPLHHQEVMDTAERARDKFITLVKAIVEKWK
ncbi:MAG: purine-nucleoside phosphorylase [Petroclostridium sp.]|jgi:purine-nucleoside phosphorylase|uniref:purine-nucleoside phosphorylase n=1 Tax=Petroclostridium xylanilyticum TaxID=1792311 RepID=UPI000B984FF0|nr:purine-nucleoside phosphorylase [Petroclostridium xylanilyticum]MBZ4646001.1 purine nucleoside phosphorylase inosine and guanosine-specific [Clostridia bacterium]MDK2810136.1 purine-nucleoside phosphorylase [Petroclostridium sp.]